VRKSRFAAPLKEAAAKHSFDVSSLPDVLAFRYHGAVYRDNIVIACCCDPCAGFDTMAVGQLFELIINPTGFRTVPSLKSGEPTVSVQPSRNARPEYPKGEFSGKHI
jgi:hypothetical protein